MIEEIKISDNTKHIQINPDIFAEGEMLVIYLYKANDLYELKIFKKDEFENLANEYFKQFGPETGLVPNFELLKTKRSILPYAEDVTIKNNRITIPTWMYELLQNQTSVTIRYVIDPNINTKRK